MLTTREFVRRYEVSILDVTRSDPPDGDDQWDQQASHRIVTLGCAARKMLVPFHMGAAHVGTPPIDYVLDGIAADAAHYENAPAYADWCAELGYEAYDDNERRTYGGAFDQAERQARELRVLLGEDGYRVLLWETAHP
jgi:hypothetical protein